ncbi:hypothetical protein YC2023_039761 [Brassica napus]
MQFRGFVFISALCHPLVSFYLSKLGFPQSDRLFQIHSPLQQVTAYSTMLSFTGSPYWMSPEVVFPFFFHFPG